MALWSVIKLVNSCTAFAVTHGNWHMQAAGTGTFSIEPDTQCHSNSGGFDSSCHSRLLCFCYQVALAAHCVAIERLGG